MGVGALYGEVLFLGAEGLGPGFGGPCLERSNTSWVIVTWDTLSLFPSLHL